MNVILFVTLWNVFYTVTSAPQSIEGDEKNTGSNDTKVTHTKVKDTTELTVTESTELTVSMEQTKTTVLKSKPITKQPVTTKNPVTTNPIANSNTTNTVQKIFKVFSISIIKIIEIPKINNVLRNVGTCVVNGVMEIVTYYLPAPVIPLIASAAGMMIPFEPIITLRRRMPVTSYRRAFQTAVNGFLNTFDRYKRDDDDDPYMTRRFRKRFLSDDSKENKM